MAASRTLFVAAREGAQESHGRAQDPSHPPHPRLPQVPPSPSGKPGPATRLQLPAKLFVLDTNVLMHDPTSLFRFEEHDIYLPILTLEELDNNKKGVERSRAQRAAGVALPGRARHRDAERHRRGHPPRREVGRRRDRQALPADRGDHDGAAVVARERQGRQPDPRRRHASAASASEAPREPGQQGHQHADQGARAGASPPRTTSTTRCSRTPSSSTPGCRSCRPISGNGTARGWNRGSRAATRTTA